MQHLLIVLFRKEFLNGKFVDRQELVQAFNGDIYLSLLDAPVVYTGQVMVVGEVFRTGVSVFLSQFLQFLSYILQCLLDRFVFHRQGFLLWVRRNSRNQDQVLTPSEVTP